jgi:hypothetical protein
VRDHGFPLLPLPSLSPPPQDLQSAPLDEYALENISRAPRPPPFGAAGARFPPPDALFFCRGFRDWEGEGERGGGGGGGGGFESERKRYGFTKDRAPGSL